MSDELGDSERQLQPFHVSMNARNRDVINPVYMSNELGESERKLQPFHLSINDDNRVANGHNISIDARNHRDQSQHGLVHVNQVRTAKVDEIPDISAVMAGVTENAFSQPLYDEIPIQHKQREAPTYNSPLPILRELEFDTNDGHQFDKGPPLPCGHPLLDRAQDTSQSQTKRINPEYKNLPPFVKSGLITYENQWPLRPSEYMHLQVDDTAVSCYQPLSTTTVSTITSIANPCYGQNDLETTKRNFSVRFPDDGNQYEFTA